MKLARLKDTTLKGKAVLVRVDYNVSMIQTSKGMTISDDTRMRLSLPTLRYILKQKPKRVVLMSHLGRPSSSKDAKFSLKPLVHHLKHLLHHSVLFVSDYTTKKGQDKVASKTSGEVILLENVRYHSQEEQNNRRFSAQLAQLGDIYVNDAFGSSHRAHASVVGVADHLPAVAGLLLQKEIKMIDTVMLKAKHPFVAILGGAKATTKIPMLEKLMTKADDVLLGGGVANTFLKAFGLHIGRSLYSAESLRLAQNLIWKATRVNTNLWMPSDVVIGTFASERRVGVVGKDEIPSQFMALDIGPKTAKEFTAVIAKAKTILWNGPLGANELKPFRSGTEAVYQAIIANTSALSVVGGGDTLASIKGHDHLSKITHISTGGGAMLEYIEKGTLPGLEVVSQETH